VYLFFCDVDTQLSHQVLETIQVALEMFGFPFFMISASRLSFILFIWSLHVHLLAHLMTSWLSQILWMSSLPKMHLKILIFVILLNVCWWFGLVVSALIITNLTDKLILICTFLFCSISLFLQIISRKNHGYFGRLCLHLFFQISIICTCILLLLLNHYYGSGIDPRCKGEEFDR